MRTLLATLAALALLAFLPAPASAQQSGVLTVVLEPTPHVFSPDLTQIVLSGMATLTVDATAYANPMGIPVQYSVTDVPPWASVLVSPASDVFTLPMTPGPTASVTMTRVFTVTITAPEDLTEDSVDLVEIAAQTEAQLLSTGFTGYGSTAVTYDAPELEPCPDHLAASGDWDALAVEAAEAYNAHQAAQARDGDGEEVSVQTGGASTLPLPWVVVGGFALIGAGVGLVLRRRYGAA